MGTRSVDTPVITTTSAVIVQMTIVSMNGSSSATTPSDTGSSVLAAAWAMGAEPWPASLEKRPRLTPHIIVTSTAPTPVPATPAEGLKASRTMSASVAGIWPTFMPRMSSAALT